MAPRYQEYRNFTVNDALEAAGKPPYQDGSYQDLEPSFEWFQNPPQQSAAVFSTGYGSRPFRHVTEGSNPGGPRCASWWYAAEIQRVSDELRRNFPDVCRNVRKLIDYSGLFMYWDAHDIFVRGTQNLWNVIHTIASENEFANECVLKRELEALVLEVLKQDNVKNRLKSWNPNMEPDVFRIFAPYELHAFANANFENTNPQSPELLREIFHTHHQRLQDSDFVVPIFPPLQQQKASPQGRNLRPQVPADDPFMDTFDIPNKIVNGVVIADGSTPAFRAARRQENLMRAAAEAQLKKDKMNAINPSTGLPFTFRDKPNPVSEVRSTSAPTNPVKSIWDSAPPSVDLDNEVDAPSGYQDKATHPEPAADGMGTHSNVGPTVLVTNYDTQVEAHDSAQVDNQKVSGPDVQVQDGPAPINTLITSGNDIQINEGSGFANAQAVTGLGIQSQDSLAAVHPQTVSSLGIPPAELAPKPGDQLRNSAGPVPVGISQGGRIGHGSQQSFQPRQAASLAPKPYEGDPLVSQNPAPFDGQIPPSVYLPSTSGPSGGYHNNLPQPQRTMNPTNRPFFNGSAGLPKPNVGGRFASNGGNWRNVGTDDLHGPKAVFCKPESTHRQNQQPHGRRFSNHKQPIGGHQGGPQPGNEQRAGPNRNNANNTQQFSNAQTNNCQRFNQGSSNKTNAPEPIYILNPAHIKLPSRDQQTQPNFVTSNGQSVPVISYDIPGETNNFRPVTTGGRLWSPGRESCINAGKRPNLTEKFDPCPCKFCDDRDRTAFVSYVGQQTTRKKTIQMGDAKVRNFLKAYFQRFGEVLGVEGDNNVGSVFVKFASKQSIVKIIMELNNGTVTDVPGLTNQTFKAHPRCGSQFFIPQPWRHLDGRRNRFNGPPGQRGRGDGSQPNVVPPVPPHGQSAMHSGPGPGPGLGRPTANLAGTQAPGYTVIAQPSMVSADPTNNWAPRPAAYTPRRGGADSRGSPYAKNGTVATGLSADDMSQKISDLAFEISSARKSNSSTSSKKHIQSGNTAAAQSPTHKSKGQDKPSNKSDDEDAVDYGTVRVRPGRAKFMPIPQEWREGSSSAPSEKQTDSSNNQPKVAPKTNDGDIHSKRKAEENPEGSDTKRLSPKKKFASTANAGDGHTGDSHQRKGKPGRRDLSKAGKHRKAVPDMTDAADRKASSGTESVSNYTAPTFKPNISTTHLPEYPITTAATGGPIGSNIRPFTESFPSYVDPVVQGSTTGQAPQRGDATNTNIETPTKTGNGKLNPGAKDFVPTPPGKGYSAAPAITVSGAGGQGATASSQQKPDHLPNTAGNPDEPSGSHHVPGKWKSRSNQGHKGNKKSKDDGHRRSISYPNNPSTNQQNGKAKSAESSKTQRLQVPKHQETQQGGDKGKAKVHSDNNKSGGASSTGSTSAGNKSPVKARQKQSEQPAVKAGATSSNDADDKKAGKGATGPAIAATSSKSQTKPDNKHPTELSDKSSTAGNKSTGDKKPGGALAIAGARIPAPTEKTSSANGKPTQTKEHTAATTSNQGQKQQGATKSSPKLPPRVAIPFALSSFPPLPPSRATSAATDPNAAKAATNQPPAVREVPGAWTGRIGVSNNGKEKKNEDGGEKKKSVAAGTSTSTTQPPQANRDGQGSWSRAGNGKGKGKDVGDEKKTTTSGTSSGNSSKNGKQPTGDDRKGG